MLILEPFSMEKVWGTDRLHNYQGDPEIDKIGLIYSAAGTSSLSNPINDSEFKEKNFYDAVKNNPSTFGLTNRFKEFPVIISFTAGDEDLSIQVHPTDAYALAHEGRDYGKSESWYFIEGPDEGWVYLGSKEENKDIITEKMTSGNFEDVIDKKKVEKDDLLFIPSGTLHALTKGSLVYEIQQSTDITYRFYDFNRVDSQGNTRELHMEKAIDTLKTDNDGVLNTLETDTVVEDPYTLKLLKSEKEHHNSTDIAQILTVLKGRYLLNDNLLTPGSSVVVFPDELIEIHTEKIGEIMVATPNIDKIIQKDE